MCSASTRGHVFFTESRYYVIVSSLTSSRHVTDVYVYTAAPSVDRRRDVIGCRLASVEAWSFTLSPGNDDDDDFYYYNNTVSLFVKSRDFASSPRDKGISLLR